jgi:hypothetical protein
MDEEETIFLSKPPGVIEKIINSGRVKYMCDLEKSYLQIYTEERDNIRILKRVCVFFFFI